MPPFAFAFADAKLIPVTHATKAEPTQLADRGMPAILSGVFPWKFKDDWLVPMFFSNFFLFDKKFHAISGPPVIGLALPKLRML